MEKSMRELGVPITEEDYKGQLKAAIEKNKRLIEKYQRRLDKGKA